MLLKSSLLILCFCLMGASSCSRGIVFNPDWHVGDSQLMAVVPEEGEPVMCEAPEFEKYACMHQDKVKELREILLRARLPKDEKLMMLKKLDGALIR